jgi:thiol:disulfide interchange protein DsbD
MKKISATLVFTFIVAMSFAQIENPVSWSYEAKKKTANTYEIVITANVENPWHIYSQNTGKGGPIATEIKFKPNPLVTIQAGKPKELGKVEKVMDNNFGPPPVQVSYYSDKVQFVQTVTVKGSVKTNIAGTVEYMVCNDSKCLPPTKKSFDLKLQ